VISRFHPRDFATVGLQYASFVVGVGSSLALARRTTRSVFGRSPLSDSLLEHGGGEQITGFDTLVFELSKRHRPSIGTQAPADNFVHFIGDLPQSIPLRG
jgi:hypothetical protein